MTMTTYQEIRKTGQETVQGRQRAAILDVAGRLLVSQGLAALTMRRIANEVGSSTKVLYTMFGGKEGLIEALCQEGFDRFALALESVPASRDRREYLIALGRAHRAYALAEPDYYRVMFGAALPGYTPDPRAHRENRTFAAFASLIETGMGEGAFQDGDPAEIAETFWAALHGAASLEIAGHLDDGERHVDRLVAALCETYLRTPT